MQIRRHLAAVACVFGFLCAAMGARVLAQTAVDGYAAPVSGLSLRIHPIAVVSSSRFVKRFGLYYADVKIPFEIRNCSAQPIRFASASAYGLLRILVRSERGRLLSQLGPVGVADKLRKLDEKSLVTIAPGQSIADTITLDTLRELPKPGAYRITGALYAGNLSMFEPSTLKKIRTGEVEIWRGPKAESLPVPLIVN